MCIIDDFKPEKLQTQSGGLYHDERGRAQFDFPYDSVSCFFVFNGHDDDGAIQSVECMILFLILPILTPHRLHVSFLFIVYLMNPLRTLLS